MYEHYIYICIFQMSNISIIIRYNTKVYLNFIE